MSLTAHSQAHRSHHRDGQGTVKSPPGFPPAAVRSHQARLNSSRHLQPTAGSNRFFPSCLRRQGRCSQHQGYHCHVKRLAASWMLFSALCSSTPSNRGRLTGSGFAAFYQHDSEGLSSSPELQGSKSNETLPKAIVPRSGETLRMSQLSSSTAPQRCRSGDQQGRVPPCWRRQRGLELFSRFESCPGLAALELNFLSLFLS